MSLKSTINNINISFTVIFQIFHDLFAFVFIKFQIMLAVRMKWMVKNRREA